MSGFIKVFIRFSTLKNSKNYKYLSNLQQTYKKMLEFLKKIFQNEEQEIKKAIEISLQNLEEWLNEKSKPLMEELQQSIEEILMKVNEESQRTRINVEVLENAKLQNSNIPFKAMQYMEGNRKAYVKSINIFLGNLEINNRDYFYLSNFCKIFDELINDLNKGTLRSYTILQEFFAHETDKIAQNLKNFDMLFSELKSRLSDKKIADVNNVNEKIKSLKIKIKQKINFDVDAKSIEAELKLSNNEKDKTIADIGNFNKSEEHNNFLKLNEWKKNKAGAFYSYKHQILQSFSILERALRKYSHIAFEHEETILGYLKEPIESLANDKNLEILQILKNLQNLLIQNKLQIDYKKKEKSLEEIRKLNKEFIDQFLKKYFSFRSEMEEIDGKIKATRVPEKFRDFNKKLEEINLMLEKINEEFGKLKNDSAKLNETITNLKNEIEKSIKDIFGEVLKVLI